VGITVFSGTVKIQKLDKKVVSNTINTDKPDNAKKTWKDFIWIPIVVLVGTIGTIIIRKLLKTKNSVL